MLLWSQSEVVYRSGSPVVTDVWLVRIEAIDFRAEIGRTKPLSWEHKMDQSAWCDDREGESVYQVIIHRITNVLVFSLETQTRTLDIHIFTEY